MLLTNELNKCLLILFCWFRFISTSDGQSDVEVDLIAKKYVERGSSVTLICKHNVEPEKLYKVTWLKGNSKVFEYINGRLPPYRNFSVPGAEIDVSWYVDDFEAWNLIFRLNTKVLQLKPKRSDAQESRLRSHGSVLLWGFARIANLHQGFERGASSCLSWVLTFNIVKCLRSPLDCFFTSHHSSHPSFSFLYSSAKRSTIDCLQKAAVLRGGEAGSKLFDVTIETCSPHSLADKWQKSKYLKLNFLMLLFFFCRRVFLLPRPQSHQKLWLLMITGGEIFGKKYFISIFLGNIY